MKFGFISTVIFSTFLSFTAAAADIQVSGQYARETIPGTSISSAYMTIANNQSTDVTLTGISSSISERIEMHEHLMADGMMKMQQVDSILIKANDRIVLQPHGYHLMIFNLHQPLMANNEISLTLHFANGDNEEIIVPIQALTRNAKTH